MSRGNGAKPASKWSFRTNPRATVYLGVMDRAGSVPRADLKITEVAVPESAPLPEPGSKKVDFRHVISPSHDLLRVYLPKPPARIPRLPNCPRASISLIPLKAAEGMDARNERPATGYG